MLKGFDPIISKEPKVMILGSMPSAVSLEKQEYYGYAHNRFWKIMSDVFEMPISTYEEKKQIILSHHLLLWDVIGECEREGRLDSKIHNEKVNPIQELLEIYPSIQFVICNGRKSYDLYQKHFSHLSLSCVYLERSFKETKFVRNSMGVSCHNNDRGK